MEVKTNDYRVWYDPETATVNFQGLIRESQIADYKPLEELLEGVIAQKPPVIAMNLQELEFLNSSGMTILSRFVIGVRNKKIIQLVVCASKKIAWQNKSLVNWQRLMPGMTLKYE